jgi:hypothetical protein
VSKVDALRALREAKYAARAEQLKEGGQPLARAATKPAPVTEATAAAQETPAAQPGPMVRAAPPARPVPIGQGDPVTNADTDTTDGAPALCGHRNIGNKTCRRPAGHAEKNHRYK